MSETTSPSSLTTADVESPNGSEKQAPAVAAAPPPVLAARAEWTLGNKVTVTVTSELPEAGALTVVEAATVQQLGEGERTVG